MPPTEARMHACSFGPRLYLGHSRFQSYLQARFTARGTASAGENHVITVVAENTATAAAIKRRRMPSVLCGRLVRVKERVKLLPLRIPRLDGAIAKQWGHEKPLCNGKLPQWLAEFPQ